ncbi:hypothetical protein CFD26_101536 [Aspergillus turcosus]|uniref:Up-regulated in Daf-2 domain-containing protein n=1 Tax=Aspergillus turcosus TaxID=1245748 RepID=A0A421D972_9EURO|nr:hypothetical protein CFD26_101536 [Aspergillus turcosus]
MGVPSPLTSGPTNATGERARYGTLGQSPKATDKYGNRLGGSSGLADQTAQIGITNKLPVTLSKVTLEHHYSDWGWESRTWEEVNTNSSTAANFEARYLTGWDAWGTDHWRISIYFEDGAVFYTSTKDYMMRQEDNYQHGLIWFEITGKIFNIKLRSGACKSPIDYGLVPYKIDGETIRRKYTTYNFVRLQGTPFKNQKQDKECGIRPEDAGKDITIFIYPTGWSMGIPSGPCADSWITPLGYNTVAFIRIENNFGQTARYISLTHQYSSDQAYTYDYPYIFQGEESSQLNMVEYNTGAFHPGLDYWTVDVFLEDDKHYQNSKPGKECYLDERDAAAGTLVFGVSESKFNIDLPSGSCGDGMKALGQVDVLLSADPHLPYNKNCYLAAHNAFANYAAGYIVANQALSIDTQLSMGVSTLLLDIWGKPIRYLTNNPFATPISLLSALKTINQYLTHFNKNIITIMIEDNIDAAHHTDLWSIFQSAGVTDKVFWPAPAMEKDVNWPTLWSMLYENQRLVVFSDYNGRDKVFPYQWDFMSENVYGAESLTGKHGLTYAGDQEKVHMVPKT